MANTTQMLRGNTVYGSGSYAPNQGHVSAQGVQGYLQRDMTNQNQMASSVGGDGKSDTRSGASASLRDRLNQGSNQGSTWGQLATPGGGPNPGQTPTYAASTPTGSPLYSGTVTAAAKPAAVPTGVTGKLSLPGNIDYADSVLGAYSSLSAQLNQNYNDAVANETEYANNMYGLNKEYAKQQGVTRSTQGGQGTLYSSANVNAVKNDLEGYNTQANEQKTVYQNNRNAFANTAQTTKNAWTGQLQQAARTDAEKKSAAAKARAAADAAKKAADTKSAKQKKAATGGKKKGPSKADYAAANKRLNNPQSKAKLKSFEKEFGFKADGKLGPKTLAAIKKRAKDPKNKRANELLDTLQGRSKPKPKRKPVRRK